MIKHKYRLKTHRNNLKHFCVVLIDFEQLWISTPLKPNTPNGGHTVQKCDTQNRICRDTMLISILFNIRLYFLSDVTWVIDRRCNMHVHPLWRFLSSILLVNLSFSNETKKTYYTFSIYCIYVWKCELWNFAGNVPTGPASVLCIIFSSSCTFDAI